MDQKYKELIEEAYKSEYFNFILERELKQKVSEMLQRNKWILSLIMILIIIIITFLGFQISDVYKIKKTLKSEIDSLKIFANEYKVEATKKREEITFLDKIMDKSTNITDKYYEMLNTDYENIKKRVNSGLADQKTLSRQIKIFKDSTKKGLDNFNDKILTHINSVNSQIKDWEGDMDEIKNISSTVYAYVERGKERYPGSNEYKPAYVDLPFSQNELVITFNKGKSKREKSEYGDYNDKIKEVELYIKVLDADNQSLFSDAFILRESRPKSIPETEHIIEAQFIYRPPNLPWYTIPDFVILAISIKK